jgi:hypothetical protein
MKNKAISCISVVFEVTGWIVNILTILEHLGLRTIEIPGTKLIIILPWPQQMIWAAFLILYGLISAAALLWYVINRLIVKTTEAVMGFLILHGIVTSTLVIPFIPGFEQTILANIKWPYTGIAIWLGYFTISSMAGWFVCRFATAPLFPEHKR